MTKKFLVPIVLPADPVAAMEAVTKQYVDGKSAPDEVWIGATEPTDPALELWYDTDAESVTPVQAWNSAWGIVGQSIKTTSQTASSAATYFDVTNMAVTFTAVAGRLYRATASFAGNASASGMASNDWNAIRIQYNGATLAGSQQTIQSIGSQEAFQTVMPAREFPAGAVALKVAAYFGGSLGVIVASTEFPCTFVVEDVGPAVGAVPAPTNPTVTQWNSAWGIVAQAAMKPAGTATVASTPVSMAVAPLTFTMLAGRRYRIAGRVRALTGGANNNPQGYAMIFRDGGQWADTYYTPMGANLYSPVLIDAFMDGDGATHTWDFRLQVNSVVATAYPDGPGSWFVIEDVGPAAGAVPIANPNPAVGATRTGPQASIPASAYTNLTWATNVRLSGIGATAAGLVVQTAGAYTLSVMLGSGVGTAGCYLSLNLGAARYDFVSSGNGRFAGSATVWLDAGETMTCWVWNANTSALAFTEARLDAWKAA